MNRATATQLRRIANAGAARVVPVDRRPIDAVTSAAMFHRFERSQRITLPLAQKLDAFAFVFPQCAAWVQWQKGLIPRNAGQVLAPHGRSIPGRPLTVLSDPQCATDFDAYFSANAAEYSTRDAALRAYAALPSTTVACAGWVTRQLASSTTPIPSTMTDAQCAHAWDAFPRTGYASTVDALNAFATSQPLCAAWATAQLAIAGVRSDAQCATDFASFLAANPLGTHVQFRALNPACAAWSRGEELRTGGVTTRTTVPQASDSDCATRLATYRTAAGNSLSQLEATRAFGLANPDCKDFSDAQATLLAALPGGPSASTSGGSSALLLAAAVVAALALSGGKMRL